MSTNNFDNKRCDYTYIVQTSYYDEELEETIFDEFIYEDTIENIVYEFQNIEKETEYSFSYNDNIKLSEELRSYPAKSIGYFYYNLTFLGEEIELEFIPKIVSGYYDHCNLDYELNIKHEYSVYDNFEELLNDLIEYSYLNNGLIKIHSKKFLIDANYHLNRMITIIQSVFMMYSDPYEVAYRFSNGETGYSKVS